MTISNILNQNLESFYTWSDNDTPPLDTNKKTFVEKEKENVEFFEGWRASMEYFCCCKSLTINDLQSQGGCCCKSLILRDLAMVYD